MARTAAEKVSFELPAFTERTLHGLTHGGILLSSISVDAKPNVMTIGWGLIGTLWRRPVFLVAVRPTRFTFLLLESSGCFTVNVPREGMDEALKLCGTTSGRTVDKFKEASLTPMAGRVVASPSISECAVHYECKVIHKDRLIPDSMAEEVMTSIYPRRQDFHTLYVGEIMATYADKDATSLMSKSV